MRGDVGDPAPGRPSGGHPCAGRGDLRTPRSCTPQASGSQPPAELGGGGGTGRDLLTLCRLPPGGKWGRGGPEEGNFPGFFLQQTPRLVQLEKFV